MKKRKVLQASFNLTDKFEVGLLNHANAQGDASKYIKRLIYVDMEGFRHAPQALTVDVSDEDVDTLLDAMNSVSL